ncbi:glycine--tRNA ligase subunit beta [Pacificimonas flava]|uniref:Glycine--tRNA ligase beta subunit n=2 Tax=Pacificimonas TaxID=1960290 RepID=A0A219B955_9SPHN|nr:MULTISPECIES: glycine--tRNA ligase subunit beta [Pacificimonas]MBZ6377237.1 glycine--tRNA ligase subunit beta [Pacificimonas aurantium]OWV34656.1 glycine--tRNA ligase subunit beta [Pacificimonas flava]
MSDFLLELRCEEIPARMQAKACDDLEKLFADQLASAGLKASAIETHATPRRLALIARGLPAETQAVSEERRGPREDAPDKAIEGFLRGAGLTRDQLEVREEKKGRFYFAVIETPGRKTADILAEAVPAIVRAFPWPKSMRWGEASRTTDALRWVRPLQGIVALLDGETVSFEVGGIAAGRTTVGHRFMSGDGFGGGEIEISSADDYEDKLRAARVILRAEERRAIILDRAKAACAEAGLTLIEDAALLAENAGLTEWPVPLLGRFDEAFLEVPPEAIQLAMKVHQKYFSVADRTGALTNAFVCTANIEAPDGGEQIVAGNRKVLAARLSDARFFWEQDLKTGLDAMAAKLGDIVFHEKLGTIADKVERVAKLARWLASEGIVPGCDPEKAERAARLSKADLVSQMVYEFPELQGVMGGYYAQKAGEDPDVAAAIRDHYKPVGQTDEVPTAPVTVAVSVADKLDTVTLFFAIGQQPTGSRDPFALRRAMMGVMQTIQENRLRLHLVDALHDASKAFLRSASSDNRLFKPEVPKSQSTLEVSTFPDTEDWFAENWFVMPGPFRDISTGAEPDVIARADYDLIEWPDFLSFEEVFLAFIQDRLKFQQRSEGTRHDLIDAVFANGRQDDIVRLLARVKALQSFIGTPDGEALLAGYKRANNILKAEAKKGDLPDAARPGADEVTTDFPYEADPAEAHLASVLGDVMLMAENAIRDERFEDAMAALANLRAPIDRFFDQVTVNADDAEKRAHRLALLARIRDAVHQVADFSRIEG